MDHNKLFVTFLTQKVVGTKSYTGWDAFVKQNQEKLGKEIIFSSKSIITQTLN
jgi:hypothetical protein